MHLWADWIREKKFNFLWIYYITNCTIIKYISHFDIIRVIPYVLRNILSTKLGGGGGQSILFGREIFWIIESNSNTTQLIERNKMKIQTENNESSNYEYIIGQFLDYERIELEFRCNQI